jgi:hypothetical protein
MIPSVQTARTSPRQAIVVEATGNHLLGGDRRADLGRSVLLDLLGSLVGVNGASISMVVDGPAQARAIAGIVPPGIDLLSPPVDLAPDGALGWAIEYHLARAFSAVVSVASDVVGLPTRTVATALSSLTGADVVLGATPADRVYLLGVRGEVGVAVAIAGGLRAGFGAARAATIREAAAAREAVARSVERRLRLTDQPSLDALRQAFASAPASAPRTAALLRSANAAEDAGIVVPSTFGDGERDLARGAER